MRIKDIKAGGWVRYISDDAVELAKVREFKYYKEYSNGYCFHFEGQDYGLLFERKDFKYSDDVADLIKKDECVVKIQGHYMVGKSFSKEEFIKEVKNEKDTDGNHIQRR